MCSVCSIRVAEHVLQVATSARWMEQWITSYFPIVNGSVAPDLSLHIEDGYGRPFESFDIRIDRTEAGTCYTRADYKLEINSDYRTAKLQVYDDYSLKHALLHLYSSFIVHFEWGLLIHSSCAVDRDQAYLFAGSSGAGKSTVAVLSAPRQILSDEASLVFIPDNGEVRVYNSPFRSDFVSRTEPISYPLAAIHLLHQSDSLHRNALPSSVVFHKLMGNVFYWAHDPNETAKVIRLIEKLAKYGRAYDLYFQKNSLFWGLIS